MIDIPTLTSIKIFLVTTQEPIELFAFGVALVTVVGALRSFLDRANVEKSDEGFSGKRVANNLNR